MIYLGIFAIAIALWMAYEVWRAPVLRSDKDDGFTVVRSERSLKDLLRIFNKKNNDHTNNTRTS